MREYQTLAGSGVGFGYPVARELAVRKDGLCGWRSTLYSPIGAVQGEPRHHRERLPPSVRLVLWYCVAWRCKNRMLFS